MKTMMLRVMDLKVEEKYQRGIKEQLVNKIVNDFNENMLGVVTVFLRDGKFYIVDGQHRCIALMKLGIELVLCLLIEEKLTIEQEADLFLGLNLKRNKIDKKDVFKAKVTAKDPSSLRIVELLDINGLEISRTGNSSKGKIVAVESLEQCYKIFGYELLEKVVRLIKCIYGDDGSYFRADIIRGYCGFVKKTNVDEKELIKKMKTIPIQKLINTSKVNRQMLGGTIEKSMSLAILENYNLARKNKVYLTE